MKTSEVKNRSSSSSVPRLQTNVCAVIRMGVGDTAIARALSTCKEARFHQVFIVDPTRGESDYANQPAIAELRALKIKVLFMSTDEMLYSKMQNDHICVDVPPDFYAVREQTLNLLQVARRDWTKYKRFALAPTYVISSENSHALGLMLMLHIFWSLISILYGYRLYRGSYMVATVLKQELDTVLVPDEALWNSDKRPYLFGDLGSRSAAPPDRGTLNNFLYLVAKESFNLNRWIFLVLYLMALTPYLSLLTHGPYKFMELFARDTLKLSVWAVHFFIGLVYWQKYFDTSAIPVYVAMLHIVSIPLLTPVFLIQARTLSFFRAVVHASQQVFYARFVWRGFGGKVPELSLPPLLPIVRQVPFGYNREDDQYQTTNSPTSVRRSPGPSSDDDAAASSSTAAPPPIEKNE